MNLHSVTPKDLKEFQLQNYTELLKNPRSEKHERFLKQQIRLLNGKDKNINSDRIVFRYRGNNILRERTTQVQEGIERRFRDQKF